MAWCFTEGFELYNQSTIASAGETVGYWDSLSNGSGCFILAGRFANSRALGWASNASWVKTSGQNDAVHHFVVAYMQLGGSGATLGPYFTLSDGATAQCSVVFRGDGALLLTSGASTGSALATFTGAVPAQNVWYAFEIEVVINNATGSFTVRRNGNPANDFTAGSLNTRVSANNYANRLTMAMGLGFGANFDDVMWRSDAASVAWMGDVRCYTRMPVTDVSALFFRTPSGQTQTPFGISTIGGLQANVFKFCPIVPLYDGSVTSVVMSLNAGFTGNMKCSIYAASGAFASGGQPTTVLGSATPIVNPATGNNTFTFGTPVSITKGNTFYVAFAGDVASGTWNFGGNNTGLSGSGGMTYATFPAASPTGLSSSNAVSFSFTYSVASNCSVVADAQIDALNSYVYDTTVGDADFYAIAGRGTTPGNVIAVTTRGYMQKSDAGTRTAAVQVKSGATTVASPTLVLQPTWTWTFRTDVVDPATGVAWLPAAVNAVNVGPIVIA